MFGGAGGRWCWQRGELARPRPARKGRGGVTQAASRAARQAEIKEAGKAKSRKAQQAKAKRARLADVRADEARPPALQVEAEAAFCQAVADDDDRGAPARDLGRRLGRLLLGAAAVVARVGLGLGAAAARGLLLLLAAGAAAAAAGFVAGRARVGRVGAVGRVRLVGGVPRRRALHHHHAAAAGAIGAGAAKAQLPEPERVARGARLGPLQLVAGPLVSRGLLLLLRLLLLLWCGRIEGENSVRAHSSQRSGGGPTTQAAPARP